MTCMVRKPLIIKDAQQDIVNQWGSTGKHLQLDFIDILCFFFTKTRQFYCTQNFKLGFTSNDILLVIRASGNVLLFYLVCLFVFLLPRTYFLVIIWKVLDLFPLQMINIVLGGGILRCIFTNGSSINFKSRKCNPYSCCWTLVKSNNPIKIYQFPWVNSPNTKEQLGGTEGTFHCRWITETHQNT